MSRKRLAAVGTALLLAFGGSVLTASSATAGAVGYVSFPKSEFCVGWTCYSASPGVLGHSIVGSGRTAQSENADAAGASLCYSSFDLVRKNANGSSTRSHGKIKNGCRAYDSRHVRNFTYAKSVTQSCAQYMQNGVARATQCFWIS